MYSEGKEVGKGTGTYDGCGIGTDDGCDIGTYDGCGIGTDDGCGIGTDDGCGIGTDDGCGIGSEVGVSDRVSSNVMESRPITDFLPEASRWANLILMGESLIATSATNHVDSP